MIQRIQSVFLLLAGIASFGLFGVPFATSERVVEASSLFNDGAYSIQDHVGILALFCAAGALALGTIFLFKNRKLQLNLGRMAIVANMIGIILMIVIYIQDKIPEDNMVSEGIGLALPILALVFLFLAMRFINKDEKLVRSTDRLR